MVPWYAVVLAGMTGAVVSFAVTALFAGQKINRVLGASRRALGYLNNNSPREAWKVLDALMNEEDVP